ncbi:MAG: SDR family NAD(P)-dependent oxidoreductase [Myxococcaceae bacterium]|nr:SDR family NAD(P)-dependent oxidoreductase [Myxococcaceae bacterium]
MRPPLDSGTVLIVGACSGLGREIARQLSLRAGTLVLVASEVGLLEALRAELEARNPTLGVILMACDISRPGEVGEVLAELARQFVAVDVLVNASATQGRALFAHQRWGDIERMLVGNVMTPLLLARRLLGQMLARGRGGILHIGSGAGQLFLPGAATAAATHRCLDGFLESLRLEVEGTGIVITQVAPGPIEDAAHGERARQGPRPFLGISAARCAREALAGFERGAALVYPGWGHRQVMRLLPRLPRAVRRVLGRLAMRDLRRLPGGELPRLAGSPRELPGSASTSA